MSVLRGKVDFKIFINFPFGFNHGHTLLYGKWCETRFASMLKKASRLQNINWQRYCGSALTDLGGEVPASAGVVDQHSVVISGTGGGVGVAISATHLSQLTHLVTPATRETTNINMVSFQWRLISWKKTLLWKEDSVKHCLALLPISMIPSCNHQKTFWAGYWCFTLKQRGLLDCQLNWELDWIRIYTIYVYGIFH